MADEYDLATAGKTSTSMADARLMRTTRVTLPTDFIHACAILTAQNILNQVMLGADHPVTQAFRTFLHDYTASEMYYIGRLEPHGKLAPALLLRFVQLHLVTWFRTMRGATTMAPPPTFSSALTYMLVGNVSWVPTVPGCYLQTTQPPVVSHGGTLMPAPRDPTTAAAPAAVKTSAEVNLAKNTAFDKFKATINSKTIKAAITAAGEPPVIKRDGQERPMCVSYHVKGLCYSTCKRQYNHKPHTPTKDEPLLVWCATAYN